jgi:four helix bundle protein
LPFTIYHLPFCIYHLPFTIYQIIKAKTEMIGCKMISGKENILFEKAYAFAIRIVNACRYLNIEKKEYILAKQLLRSGTSIGANIAEANGGISDADFSAKISIAYKECLETKYWLSLLKDTNLLETSLYLSVFQDAEELSKMLFATIKKMRISK